MRLALPKGRMEGNVISLLADAGITVTPTARGYRPAVSLPRVDTKMMKPQNIVQMLAHGSRDIGFAGADWVRELEVDAIELIDTGLDPVRVVAAAPEHLFDDLPQRKVRRDLLFRWQVGCSTCLAKSTHQSLSHDPFNRAGDKKRLDAHVAQTHERSSRIVRVERAKHEVPRQRSLSGVLGRFQVADFTDKYDIGIMAQDASQTGGER